MTIEGHTRANEDQSHRREKISAKMQFEQPTHGKKPAKATPTEELPARWKNTLCD